MKERPILFSGPMVRAILEGRKTQTRRVVRLQPSAGPAGKIVDLGGGEWGLLDGDLSGLWRCPYGVPGDRLWVRETWGYRGGHWSGGTPKIQTVSIEYASDGGRLDFVRGADDDAGLPKQHCRCKPEGPGRDEFDVHSDHNEELVRYWKAWRPSIFLPRWASRITLELTAARVQRLQEISEEDAQAEGPEAIDVPPVGPLWRFEGGEGDEVIGKLARPGYAWLWNQINGKRGHGWDTNPWVWALTFRRIA